MTNKMTKEQAINYLKSSGFSNEQINSIVDALKDARLEKIQHVLDSASYVENGITYSYTYDEDTRVKHIRKIMKGQMV